MSAPPRSRSSTLQTRCGGHAASPGKALQAAEEPRFAVVEDDDALAKSKYSMPVRFSAVRFAMTSGVNCVDSNEKYETPESDESGDTWAAPGATVVSLAAVESQYMLIKR